MPENFDPAMPTTFNDSYALVVYALPTAKTVVPAAKAGISNVRLLDNVFKAMALATAEYRGTSNAASTGDPGGHSAADAEADLSDRRHADALRLPDGPVVTSHSPPRDAHRDHDDRSGERQPGGQPRRTGR